MGFAYWLELTKASQHKLTTAMQHLLVWVRFSADHQIKTHAPPLVKIPDFSFKFQPCGRTPQARYLTR